MPTLLERYDLGRNCYTKAAELVDLVDPATVDKKPVRGLTKRTVTVPRAVPITMVATSVKTMALMRRM